MDRILASQWSQYVIIFSVSALLGLAVVLNALIEPEAATQPSPTPTELGLRPPQPMLVLFDELEEPALKLPNYTVSGAVESTGDPEYGDSSFQILIEQSDWDDYHVLVVSSDSELEAATEYWVVDGTIYLPSAEGGMVPARGAVDPDLNAPGWFYLRILTPEDLGRLQLIGREVVGGKPADHYEDDLSRGVPFDPPEGECYDDLNGKIDLWVDVETGLMLRIAGHMRWINCDGDEQTIRYTFSVDQQGTTQDVALQVPTPTPTASPTPSPSPTATPTPAPGEPVIALFEVSPAQVEPGGDITVRWDVRDANRVVIEPIQLVGELQPAPDDARHFAGERTVVITEATTFRLIATNDETGLNSTRVVNAITLAPTPNTDPYPAANTNNASNRDDATGGSGDGYWNGNEHRNGDCYRNSNCNLDGHAHTDIHSGHANGYAGPAHIHTDPTYIHAGPADGHAYPADGYAHPTDGHAGYADNYRGASASATTSASTPSSPIGSAN